MNRPGDSQKPLAKAQQDEQPVREVPPSYRALYLILYNSISAFLWLVVLGRVLSIATVHGYHQVYTGTGRWTKWTQTLAGLEVLHAAIGKTFSLNGQDTPLTHARHRQSTAPYDNHASRVAFSPRLGRRVKLSHDELVLTRL